METTDPGGRFQNTANCRKKDQEKYGITFYPLNSWLVHVIMFLQGVLWAFPKI